MHLVIADENMSDDNSGIDLDILVWWAMLGMVKRNNIRNLDIY